MNLTPLKKRWKLIVLLLIFLGVTVTGLLFALKDSRNNGEDGAKDGQEGQLAEAVTAYGWKEIIGHDSRDDCWIVLDINIYDVSEWEYPGKTDLAPACGKLEASEHFATDGQEAPPEELKIGIYARHGLQ